MYDMFTMKYTLLLSNLFAIPQVFSFLCTFVIAILARHAGFLIRNVFVPLSVWHCIQIKVSTVVDWCPG